MFGRLFVPPVALSRLDLPTFRLQLLTILHEDEAGVVQRVTHCNTVDVHFLHRSGGRHGDFGRGRSSRHLALAALFGEFRKPKRIASGRF